jgi:hypothetical protein
MLRQHYPTETFVYPTVNDCRMTETTYIVVAHVVSRESIRLQPWRHVYELAACMVKEADEMVEGRSRKCVA